MLRFTRLSDLLPHERRCGIRGLAILHVAQLYIVSIACLTNFANPGYPNAC